MRRFDDRDYVLEPAIKGDLALVRADTADPYGNLTFRYAQANFGPAMATRRHASRSPRCAPSTDAADPA